jgi:6-phosphogluconolactonase
MNTERAGVTLRVETSPERLADLAAAEILVVLGTAIAWRGEAHLCLAGGSTPRLLHDALARHTFDGWPHVHVWFGDERCVPPDHADSNARMAAETLLRHVGIAELHVHRPAGERDPAEAAEQYHDALQDLAERAQGEVPTFDVLILGMGDDAHTASIFPGSPLLDHVEAAPTPPWAVAIHVPTLDAWRLTLTPAVLCAARATVVLVTGTGKHEALHRVLTRSAPLKDAPARLLERATGDLAWFVDTAALFG